jgi:hypothetical protein
MQQPKTLKKQYARRGDEKKKKTILKLLACFFFLFLLLLLRWQRFVNGFFFFFIGRSLFFSPSVAYSKFQRKPTQKHKAKTASHRHAINSVCCFACICVYSGAFGLLCNTRWEHACRG